MTSLSARTLTITIDRPFDQAYAFAREPANFAKWAAGLARTLHQEDGQWLAQTPEGQAIVHFSPPNEYGVLDHQVLLPGKPPISIPLRMIANGDGTEVVFTLFRLPDITDPMFERDVASVKKDLQALRALLEQS